jgi:hypothetical protein
MITLAASEAYIHALDEVSPLDAREVSNALFRLVFLRL